MLDLREILRCVAGRRAFPAELGVSPACLWDSTEAGVAAVCEHEDGASGVELAGQQARAGGQLTASCHGQLEGFEQRTDYHLTWAPQDRSGSHADSGAEAEAAAETQTDTTMAGTTRCEVSGKKYFNPEHIS